MYGIVKGKNCEKKKNSTTVYYIFEYRINGNDSSCHGKRYVANTRADR